jgi:hypothetical protein
LKEEFERTSKGKYHNISLELTLLSFYTTNNLSIRLFGIVLGLGFVMEN